MIYREAIAAQMERFDGVFIGQQVAAQDFYGTLACVPMDRRIELPVAEELQLGMAIGMHMAGVRVMCIYQRVDFMMRAMDQLVNHLNLLGELSAGRHTGKGIIIRTTIGARKPMDAGPQHTQDLSRVLRSAVWFPVIEVLPTVRSVVEAYSHQGPVILIERQEWYGREIL